MSCWMDESLPVITGELRCSSTTTRLSQLLSPPAFRAYTAWLAKQDQATALAHWRQVLAGFTVPTPVPGVRPSAPVRRSATHGEFLLQIGAAETAAVTEFARAHRLTFAMLLQGAWALLLARWSGEADVVFGVTVSGREKTSTCPASSGPSGC